jgi:hypothetical protein
LSIYKLLLGRLVKANAYNKLHLGYAFIRLYNPLANIGRTKLYTLYKLWLVAAYNR